MTPAMTHLLLAAAVAITTAVHAAEPAMQPIPAGSYRPFLQMPGAAKEETVAAFELDACAVTNAEFLEFVRSHPQWQRSQVKRLFAEDGYLAHWAGDLDLGEANPRQPVTRISWFAAKAYAAAQGKRLVTTREWEYAARAGYASSDGKDEPAFRAMLRRWVSTPATFILPAVDADRANFHGLHGMHGVIWEWTSDFNSALVTGDSREGGGTNRQLFCGSGAVGTRDVNDSAAFMRFGLRSSLKASYTVHNLGFRCARTLP